MPRALSCRHCNRGRYVERDPGTKRRRQAALLLVLRQEPARGPQADCRPLGVHLRRMRRALQRHHPRGARGPYGAARHQAAEAPRDQERPRRVRDRPGAGQEDPVRRRLQPLQATREPVGRLRQEGRRDLQEQHPADRADRLRQDAARRDAGAAAERAVHHRRRHHADRGGLRGRGRREHHPEAAAEVRLRRGEGADRHRLHRRNRQDLAQVRQPVDHPRRVRRGRAAGAAEADRRARLPPCRRRAAASTRSRSSCRSTRTNILFIVGGAFAGLEKIIRKRSQQRRHRLRGGGQEQRRGAEHRRAADGRGAGGSDQVRPDSRNLSAACPWSPRWTNSTKPR